MTQRRRRSSAGANANEHDALGRDRRPKLRAASSIARGGAPGAAPEAIVEGELLPQLVALVVEGYDEVNRTATLRIGSATIVAKFDVALDPAVLRTAQHRGERVIATREGGVWVVLGALRTAATPGVDEGDDFVIKARRVAIHAAHEFSAVSGAASFVVRAFGGVETLAKDITARASSVHTIIGRMIRLN